MNVTVPIWGVILTLALIVVLVVGLIASSTATRLNRMHIRTDLARASLEAALGRRAAVARTAYPELSNAIARAESTPIGANHTGQRADAENDLTRRILTMVEEQPPERTLAIELSDAHTRLELARRFYNDAVTDTKALRSRPLVRVLRLAGTAPEPEYFDVADVLPPV